MLKLADILKHIESDTPESTFVQKLANLGMEAPTPAPAVAEPVAAAPAPVEPAAAPVAPVAAAPVAAAVVEPAKTAEDESLRKQAEEAIDFGMLAAESFMEHFQKLAVGVVGMTPNPDAIPANPAVQLSNQDIREADVAKIQSIIQSLTAGERMHAGQGYIQVNGTPSAPVEPVAKDEAPVLYDMAKKSDADIVTKIYDRYFGGN